MYSNSFFLLALIPVDSENGSGWTDFPQELFHFYWITNFGINRVICTGSSDWIKSDFLLSSHILWVARIRISRSGWTAYWGWVNPKGRSLFWK
jgi:hypothetical protein